MNAKQRKALAFRLAEAAQFGGGSRNFPNAWEWEDDTAGRELVFRARFPGVQALIFVDDETCPCIHWHSAAGRLRPCLFPSGGVNKCHGHKATTICTTWDALVSELSAIGDVAAAGRLFEEPADAHA